MASPDGFIISDLTGTLSPSPVERNIEIRKRNKKPNRLIIFAVWHGAHERNRDSPGSVAAVRPGENGAIRAEFTRRLQRNAKIAKNPLYESSLLNARARRGLFIKTALNTFLRDRDSASARYIPPSSSMMPSRAYFWRKVSLLISAAQE